MNKYLLLLIYIMKNNLDTEKRYESIKGIAGNAIGRVEALELPYSEDE